MENWIIIIYFDPFLVALFIMWYILYVRWYILNLDPSLVAAINVYFSLWEKKRNLKHIFHVSKTWMFILPHVALPEEFRWRRLILKGQWKPFVLHFLFIIFEWRGDTSNEKSKFTRSPDVYQGNIILILY